MKSNKSNKSIGKLAGQEVNTDQIQGGKSAIIQERPMKGGSIPKPDCGIPTQETIITNNQQLGQ